MSNKKKGDDYEKAVREVFAKLEDGRELIVNYLRNTTFPHGISYPVSIERGRSFTGGRSKREIHIDVSFSFCMPRNPDRETVPVIVECKDHKGKVSTTGMGKFAYDLLDIRHSAGFEKAVGLFFTSHDYQPGSKLIAAAENIAIASFNHHEPEPNVCFLLEDSVEDWRGPIDPVFQGTLVLGHHVARFESSSDLFFVLGELVGEALGFSARRRF